jgi:HSP20 family protein
MTLVNFRNKPVSGNFNNVLDTFFDGFPSVFRDDFATPNFKPFAPVNVKEVANGYQLEIVAPGLEKEDFTISLDKNILTISAENKSEGENKNETYLRREYRYQSFKRSFTIDENTDVENIDAKYVNGVLKLTLPKKAEVKPATKQISIQ